MIPEPIIVLGSPRSGTSMVAGYLHHCGAFAGACRPADQWNPKGYFENVAITRLRMDQNLTPTAVERVLRSEDYRGGPWLYKQSPGTWALWWRFRPRWVLVHRYDENTARSRLRGGWWPDEALPKARDCVARDHATMAHLANRMNSAAIIVQAEDFAADRDVRDHVAGFCRLEVSSHAERFVDPCLLHDYSADSHAGAT